MSAYDAFPFPLATQTMTKASTVHSSLSHQRIVGIQWPFSNVNLDEQTLRILDPCNATHLGNIFSLFQSSTFGHN